MIIPSTRSLLPSRGPSGTFGVMTNVHHPVELAAFRQQARELWPTARVVPARGLRRVIRRQRDLDEFGSRVPHDLVLAIPLSLLRQYLAPAELGISPQDEAPDLLLIPAPDAEADRTEEMRRLWRTLFHAAIDRQFDELVNHGELARDRVAHLVHQWGPTQWAEIREVLLDDFRIAHNDDTLTAFREFIAYFLELCQFQPHDVHAYFPGLLPNDRVLDWALQHFDAATLAERYRPPELATSFHGDSPPTPLPSTPGKAPVAMLQRISRSVQAGNDVRAMVDLLKAGDATYRTHLEHLVQRLVVRFDTRGSAADWLRLLQPLCAYVPEGIWPVERRILYELQKACLDLERETYAVDLVGWVTSIGRLKIKRRLTKPKWLYAARHLRVANRLIDRSRLTNEEQDALHVLLEKAVHDADRHARAELRPEITAVLEDVGLVPESAAERVSRAKAVEELLDVACEQGLIRIGHLRDAIARSRVKLPDLRGPIEFLRGDPLLQANRQLALRLDGVYRRGEIYMRWLQRTCSLFFGTKLGRVFTKYVALPVGGAFVAIEAFHHAVEAVEGAVNWFSGWSATLKALGTVAGGPAMHVAAHPDGMHEGINKTALTLVSVFFFMMLHWSRFRQQVLNFAQFVCFKVPKAIVRSPLTKILFNNPVTRLYKRHLLIPTITGGMAHLLLRFGGEDTAVAWYGSGIVAFVFLLFAHTAFGRGIEDRMNEYGERLWRIISVNFLLGLFALVVQFFQQILGAIDRTFYAVDEWLRFRSGEGRSALVFKLAFGTTWFCLTYIFRFAWNLLVEPQINPIKHFPVVTVSHKMLLPLIPSLSKQFAISPETMTTIVFGIPGIFGFMVWELKENWKLYRANAPKTLRPLVIGSHGERMRALLRPGFHSGVIPKTYAKWRKALHAGHTSRATKHHHHLHHVVESLHRFIQREFIPLLVPSLGVPIVAGEPQLSMHRVRFPIALGQHVNDMVVSIEERGGWLIASIEQVGWLPRISEQHRQAVATALLGLYHYAQVHAVREQIAAILGREAYSFDAVPEGLLIQHEGRIKFFDVADGPELQAPQQHLPMSKTMLNSVGLDWSAWSAYWDAQQPSRLQPDWQILPPESATTATPTTTR